LKEDRRRIEGELEAKAEEGLGGLIDDTRLQI
jgi:hypothetical protein